MIARVVCALVALVPACASATPPPAVAGGDKRLVIPACGYGELLYWRGAAGWACDGSEYAAVKKGYLDALDGVAASAATITVPALPPPQGVVPLLWVAPPSPPAPPPPSPPSIPPETSSPAAPCGCAVSWPAGSLTTSSGGEGGGVVEVPYPAGHVVIPHGRTLYFANTIVQHGGEGDGSSSTGWSAAACKVGSLIPWHQYPMTADVALHNVAAYLPFGMTNEKFDKPVYATAACSS